MAFDGLLKWRCIGPFRGGRVVTVAGDSKDKNTFYFGACAGGVWKTTDAGQFWECVSDGFFKTSSVGALAVSESDPNVIYAGMGESTIRIDVSHGDGVYKSTDAGKTWQHMGLADTRHISKIRIHPTNPDMVWVAAFGHAFGKHKERGVYKSVDGGKTWKKVLFKSDKAGAIDLTVDATNPRILYATIWEAYRNFWQISSGGPDSGIYKSVDGGDTWVDITSKPGIPKTVKGKMGIAASPAKAGRVWALVENKEKGGLYRSDDYGESWNLMSENQELISRAWYYMHLTADPKDAETVYVNNLSFWKSIDGGKNFSEIGTPHGDNHDLWIDPHNPDRMVQGNDGGANVSLNGGATWSSVYNQPTAQFYRLDVDNRIPYHVYGTQQDNSSIAVASRSTHQSITWNDCFTAGTGESGYIAVNPKDPDIVFVGAIGSSEGGGNCLQRYDHRTRQIRLVTTWPESMTGLGAEEDKYRFAWTYPIFYSRHDNDTIYISGNHVFKTTNEGQSWQKISPDLTKADPQTLKATGGPINRDSVGAETYATVFALAESHFEKGVLWAGSDDGLVHITKNDGKTWTNVTPKGLPKQCLISTLEPSPFDPATCYLAATKYKLDDYTPYLFKTTNYGKSWTRIDKGIAKDHFTRVIRSDPNRKGLLYAGTESGLYMSLDDGKSWQSFQLNLPITPIYDLKIKDNDLVVATHGRSFWILDDLTPLYQYQESLLKKESHLFAPRPAERILPVMYEGAFGGAPGKNYMGSLGLVAPYLHSKTPEGVDELKFLDTGENPPRGVVITYHLSKAPKDKITLTISDEQGNTIRTFSSLEDEEKAKLKENPHHEIGITANKGFNRFVWNMYEPNLPKITGDDVAGKTLFRGALVVPGKYKVTLKVGSKTQTQGFTIIPDRLAGKVKQSDLEAQYKLWKRINTKLTEVIHTINHMRDLREQLSGWEKRGSKDIVKQAKRLREKILELEKRLAVPDLRPGWPDTFNAGARLLEKLSALTSVVRIGNYKPTDQAQEAYQNISQRVDGVIDKFKVLCKGELKTLNDHLKKEGVPNIV
jgi:photosystem II stability/assembly factor-like uncharacterized protein